MRGGGGGRGGGFDGFRENRYVCGGKLQSCMLMVEPFIDSRLLPLYCFPLLLSPPSLPSLRRNDGWRPGPPPDNM